METGKETMVLLTDEIVRLGRIRPKAPPVCLHLRNYYKSGQDQAPPPKEVDYSAKAIASLSRMYLNDQEGDCVIAGKYHALGVWTGNELGEPALAQDSEVQQSYHTICGPGDNGCNITDVLDYFKAHGLIAGGKAFKIDGYVAVDNSNQLLTQVALEVFGALTLGVNLTSDCEDAGPGVEWKFEGNIVGGHDITAYGYNEKGVLISTWGKVGTLIPWRVFMKKVSSEAGVEECYANLSPDWYSKGNLAPNGIDAAALAADLAKIGGGVVPDPTPGPTPPPPPAPGPTPSPTPPPDSPIWHWVIDTVELWLKELGVMALPLIEQLVASLPLPPVVIGIIETMIQQLLGRKVRLGGLHPSRSRAG